MVSSPPVILVVEDEYIIRAALVAELEQAGWRVLEAHTGEAALAQLHSEQRIDVLVTDIQLAGYLSGWEVAEGFHTARPDIPVVYMSGKAVEKSRMVPGSVFLSKPFAPANLLAAAREAMQVSQRTA